MTMTTPVAPQSMPVQVTDPISQAMQKLLKPGAKTTEFIAMIALYTGALATLLGAFNTSSTQFNAILKVAALVSAAVSQVGYSLARGKTKAALGALMSVLASTGVVRPVPRHAATPAGEAGAAGLIDLVGAVFLLAGLIWMIVGFTHHRLDVFGLVLAGVGIGILVLFGGSFAPTRRRL